MRTVNVVAAVILNDSGDRIFATARGYGEYKGWWEFPGGKIEEGETPQQALRREIEEELDTEIEVGSLIGRVEYDYPAFHLCMDCFWCTVTNGNLTLKEAQTGRWLSKKSLMSVNWLPADLSILSSIAEGLKQPGLLRFTATSKAGTVRNRTIQDR